jgi:hypothetical protein
MDYLWDGSSSGVHNVQLLSLDGAQIIESIDGDDDLIYMASEDGSIIPGQIIQVQDDKNTSNGPNSGQEEFGECEVVTEEVITDDFLQAQGDRDEIMVEAIAGGNELQAEDDISVPLPQEVDEYTALRPFPW